MKKFILLLLIVSHCAFAFSQGKLKGTIAVDSFKLAPASTTSQRYVQTYYPQDVRLFVQFRVFADLFSHYLRMFLRQLLYRYN